MKKVNTLIIGAGISGLSYATATNKDYLILEKEEKPGGLCKTFYQDGFVWDYAGHFFHFATPEIKAFFERKIGVNDMVKCVKNTNIDYNGTMVEYPFQMNIHQLPKEEFIDCLYDLFHREEKGMYSSFQDMLYGKFGKSITEKFLKPYNEKLYACSLNELDTDAMGRFFPYANPEQIISNMKKNTVETYNSSFDYPKRGAQFFIDIILRELDQERILLNSAVSSIDTEKKKIIVNGEVIEYEYLINTMPLNKFVRLINSKAAEKIQKYLTCNKVLVFNLGFDKQSINSYTHWTYVPMKDINFYRVGYYNNILGTEKLSIYIEIGFKEDAVVDIDNELTNTLNNLKKLGIITDHNLVSYNSLIIDPGYVHITNQSMKSVTSLKLSLKGKNIFSIGRYGGWTYCSIEDCMVEAIKLAGELNGKK